DISDPETIAAILSENDLDEAVLTPGIDAAVPRYAENTDLCLENGVFGAPFYVVGGEKFWGQDRLDFLDWHLGKG
ncbi:MAG: DsbA family protein, partial [Pseudomonadota bacterium]